MSPDEQPTLHARTRARERAEDARAARADEPAEAEDLSTAQRERDTFNCSRDCESIDPEGVILRNRSPRRKRLHEDAPEHCLDQPILRPPLDRSSRDELAFAQASPFMTGATALQSNILAWLTPVAIILVMVLGGMAMANRMSWGWCMGAILGIAIAFGAPQIVTWVRGMFGV